MTAHARLDALDYDADEELRGTYSLAWAACREKRIRNGEIEPTTAEEHRWAKEGPRRASELEALRNG